jgi:hypothetical protein
MGKSFTLADWSKRGIVLHGGSRDGQQVDLIPTGASLNLSHTIAGQDIVEVYARTDQARDGRTIFRNMERRRDSED